MYEELIFIEYPREESDFQLLMFLHEMYTRKDILAQDSTRSTITTNCDFIIFDVTDIIFFGLKCCIKERLPWYYIVDML